MRRTTTLLTTACLLAGAVAGCSDSGDGNAIDCAAALTDRTGGDARDRPTVEEAEERVDALDETLGDMVRMGYEGVAKDASDTVERKARTRIKSRPGACESLSEDDYTALLMAKTIDGLGWTDENGVFDKLKMVETLGD